LLSEIIKIIIKIAQKSINFEFFLKVFDNKCTTNHK